MHRPVHRRLLSAVAVTALVTTSAIATGPAAAARAPDRHIAICASRACLLILDRATDRDGDGVTDVDEAHLDTDPDSRASVPDPTRMVDQMLRRQLPSFERHLTELVLLPTMTPDGQAIATGLGEFKLRDGDANLLKSIGIVVQDLGRNGFDAIFGLRLAGVVAPDTPPADPFDKPEMIRHVDAAWYAGGTLSGVFSYGANAGKTVAEEHLGTADRPYIQYTETGATKTTEVVYTDGSRDVKTDIYTKNGSQVEVGTSVESYDKEGNKTGESNAFGKRFTDDEGTKHTIVEYKEPVKNGSGAVVGEKDVKIHMEEKKDGTTTITTETTTKLDDGTEKTEKTVKTVDPDDEDDYQDPDYIGFDIVTPEDYARMEIRIKQISQPGPDDGNTGGPTPEPPTEGQCWPKCGGDGTLILMDPDGVVVISADAVPNFNRRVQPDYGPTLEALGGLAGQPVPATGGGKPSDPGKP